MEFINKLEPDVSKPLIIAAMQDMGNVGSIVVNFINKHLFMIKVGILKFQKKNGSIDTETI